MTDSTPRDAVLVDELLAIRCQLGERDAFDDLVSRWHAPLWRYVRRMTGDDDAAADVTQETWLRVLRGIGRLREPSRLRAWLFGIAHHVVMDRLRVKYSAAEMTTMDGVDMAADGDELETHVDALADGLARLPAIEREILTLFYLRELTLVQVADILQVPQGTVKSRLFRARHLLRRELQDPTTRGDRS